MVGLPYDCLANPLGAVRLTFEKAVASSNSAAAALDGNDWGTTDLFRDFLFQNDALSQVPLLNSSTINWVQPNTLVRFRGMIQDMLGNEFYVGAYKDGDMWRTNKYADLSQTPIGGSPSDVRVWERRLLYCVPVPGQNLWTQSSSEAEMKLSLSLPSPSKEKRQRDEDEVMGDANDPSHQPQELPCAKRMVSTDEREDGTASQSSSLQGPVEATSCMSMLSSEVDRSSFSCLVKIYDSPESDLKLNDVFEFVGVLTFEPELPVDNDAKDDVDNNFCEDELVHQLPSKVPRLHCLLHRKLTACDFLPSSVTLEPKTHLVKPIREALLRHLTTALGNDGLAAHFMLLHLLSRVHARVDSIAVGKLSLNLTCLSKESISVFGNRLNLVLRNLLPFTHHVPLTVEYLNSASLAPRKDYETNRLVSGALQLAEGSHVTIDETRLESGTLDSTGINNARLLKGLLEWQKVEYDFTYYKMDMAADVQFLILSEGKSNILPADLVLPFRPSSADSPEILAAETLQAWRSYLATMRSLPHSIEPEMQKVVEDDLVAARQADRSLGSQEFSRWLTIGRLVSVSYGETNLSMEHWQMVKELERLRRERLEGSM